MLCYENAESAERIAIEYGLTLKKSNNWHLLPKMRKVELTSDMGTLMFHGFSYVDVRKCSGKSSGIPDKDEDIFNAQYMVSDSVFAVELSSWNIQKMSLWLEDVSVLKLLGEEIKTQAQSLIADAYPLAWEREKKKQGLAAAIGLPDEDVADLRAKLPVSVRNSLMRHQWVAVKWIFQNRQCIIADQQGLGKTLETLAALEAAGAFPAVIVCPAIARALRDRSRVVPRSDSACVFTKRFLRSENAGYPKSRRVIGEHVSYPLLGSDRVTRTAGAAAGISGRVVFAACWAGRPIKAFAKIATPRLCG